MHSAANRAYTPAMDRIPTARVLEIFGNPSDLARAMRQAGIEITPQAIYQWGEYVPELRAYQLRALRPDVEWAVVRGSAAA